MNHEPNSHSALYMMLLHFVLLLRFETHTLCVVPHLEVALDKRVRQMSKCDVDPHAPAEHLLMHRCTQ